MQQVINNEANETVETLIDDVFEYVKNFGSYDPKVDVPQDLADYAKEKLDERMCSELYDEDGNCEINDGEWMEALEEIEEKILGYVESGEIWEHRDEPEDEEEQAA